MIKLIVSDIDGTLLEDGGHELEPELFDVILKLREKGIQFAAASGRQWCSIERVFEPIKDRIFYLSDNGAYVGTSKRNLFLNTVDKTLVREVVKDIRDAGLDAMISGPDVVYVDTKNTEFIRWMEEGYQFRVKQVEDLLEVEDDFIKISAYQKSNIEPATAKIREKYASRMKLTISGDMWLDCMAPGVNKGQAVRLLQESLHILPEESMAFGDQLNDLEMLHQVYYSFAIGNARNEIKQAARFQADTNVNQGVLKVLRNLL